MRVPRMRAFVAGTALTNEDGGPLDQDILLYCVACAELLPVEDGPHPPSTGTPR